MAVNYSVAEDNVGIFPSTLALVCGSGYNNTNNSTYFNGSFYNCTPAENNGPPGNTPACEMYLFTINTFVIGILCILGVIGNLFAFMVFQIDTLKTSTTFLFQGLSLTDTMLLITCFPLYSIKPLMDFLETDFYDDIYTYLLVYIFPVAMIFQTCTIWVTVLVGINRYIAVCMPYQAPRLCSVSRAKQYLLSVFLFSVLYNIPRFLSGKICHDPETGAPYPCYTESIGAKTEFNIVYNNIFYLIFMLALPVLILVLLNFRLINTLKQIKKRRCEMQTRQQAQDNNVTFVLIIVLLVFTVCQVPALFNQIFWNVFTEEYRSCGGFQFYFSCLSNMMVIVNSAVNFVIYVLFNKRFKSVMMKNFCKCGSSYKEEKKRCAGASNGATQTLLTHV